MRIGLLTFHFGENYGSLFQAYALREALRRMGHEVEIINYWPRYITHGGRWRLPTSKRNLLINAQIAYVRYTFLKSNMGKDSLGKLCDAFREQHLDVVSDPIWREADLRRACSGYDAVICGSDQIWNPPLRSGVDPAFFGAHAPENVRRISYAGSFGRIDIEPEYHEQMGELFKQMDHIGIREQSGIELAQQMSGRQGILTPDPTILLDDYAPVRGELDSDEPYVFTYILRVGGWVDDVQKSVADRLGVPSYAPVNPHQRWPISAIQKIMSPGEWLARISNARFVVTNSFHGTVFSILNHRPFISIGLGGEKRALSERLTFLLKELGLEDRFVSEETADQVDRLIDAPIDWEYVDAQLVSMREAGESFLRSALTEEKP